MPRKRPPPAPSLLKAIVGSTPQTHRVAVSLEIPGGGGLTDRYLGTIAVHDDRLAVVGAVMPAVTRRRSPRASAPSMLLHFLPDHVAQAVRAPYAALGPPSRTVSARSTSMGVDGQSP